MKRIITSMSALFVAINMMAQVPQELQVKELVLGNGMTVWLNEDHTQPKVFGAVVIKAGGKDSPNTGIAHYFEHIMFKGTDRLGTIDYSAEKPWLDSISAQYDLLAKTTNVESRATIQKHINELSLRAADYAIPNEFNRLISRYGGSGLNAATSYDMTYYHNSFLPQFIEQWCILNSERLIHPVFRGFQGELENVYEEKNRSADGMGDVLETIMKTLFHDQPYAYPILGSTESLKNPRLS
ncbi:MAG: insulinase family protein, partial [Prevotella sp.]|nr:insulinase family protein [Prevotella sp.]